MKKIDLKSPKYVLPLICLPFILLLFYVYRISRKIDDRVSAQSDSLQVKLAEVSAGVSGRGLEDKLQAFKNQYKKGDGYTALGAITEQSSNADELTSAYNQQEKRMLDSISQAMKNQRPSPFSSSAAKPSSRYSQSSQGSFPKDEQLAKMLSQYSRPVSAQSQKAEDPMAIFRAQMQIVDSMNKASMLPARAASKKAPVVLKEELTPRLATRLASEVEIDSTTILARSAPTGFIPAMLDVAMTAQSGSRVSIRLLEDILIGDHRLEKGMVVYGLVSAFTAQRVELQVNAILYHGKLLPVKLEAYDLDGIKGIYVPSSAFREFSKDLSTTSISGVNLEAGADQNKQLMSLFGRIFQSTTGAVNKLIRSNKARLAYPSLIYLIDPQQLKIKP